jgi:hypothetical protein
MAEETQNVGNAKVYTMSGSSLREELNKQRERLKALHRRTLDDRIKGADEDEVDSVLGEIEKEQDQLNASEAALNEMNKGRFDASLNSQQAMNQAELDNASNNAQALAMPYLPFAERMAFTLGAASPLIGGLGAGVARVAMARRMRALLRAKRKAKNEKKEGAFIKRKQQKDAQRREALKKKRQEAEAKGKDKEPYVKKDEEKWLAESERNRELAYDPATDSFKVNEAQAAQQAEQEGTLAGPVTRASSESGGEMGSDFFDGNSKGWDAKQASDIGRIQDSLNSGENVMVYGSQAQVSAAQQALGSASNNLVYVVRP